jgi:hypothetical protein
MQQRWMRRHKLQYSHYGMQALEMTPLAGPLFIFTNACGAALLAAPAGHAAQQQKQQECGDRRGCVAVWEDWRNVHNL